MLNLEFFNVCMRTILYRNFFFLQLKKELKYQRRAIRQVCSPKFYCISLTIVLSKFMHLVVYNKKIHYCHYIIHKILQRSTQSRINEILGQSSYARVVCTKKHFHKKIIWKEVGGFQLPSKCWSSSSKNLLCWTEKLTE